MAQIETGSNRWTVGTSDYMYSFFSTIAARLEPEGWGTRFPAIQDKLATDSELPSSDSPAALAELATIRKELSQLSPSAIVWNYDNRTLNPPWGDAIDPSITSLADYFITYTGDDLFDVLGEALKRSGESGQNVLILVGQKIDDLIHAYRRQ